MLPHLNLAPHCRRYPNAKRFVNDDINKIYSDENKKNRYNIEGKKSASLKFCLDADMVNANDDIFYVSGKDKETDLF